MSDELRDNCDVQEFAERIAANKELVESGPRFFTETVRLAEAYLALRRSHAEAVEAAVREIEELHDECPIGDFDEGYNAGIHEALVELRKHLGPAAAVGE